MDELVRDISGEHKKTYEFTGKINTPEVKQPVAHLYHKRKPSSHLVISRALKRAIDVVLASVMICFSAPLLIGVAILIKIDSTGSIFFKQTRVGLNGTLFTMYKLRTMVNSAEKQKHDLCEDNEADGPLFKIRDDPRITRIGRYLRKYSIDELPQLFNVLIGHMSMVGPRPALPEEVAEYQVWQFNRLNAIPGITGLWQVSGRSDLGFEKMVELDIHYASNWSLTLDIAILAKTIFVVISGKGAY